MSSSNCCFLTCIQISQEADQVVWYSHLFQNFPQFVMIHTVKDFSIVSEADVLLEFSWLFYDSTNVGNLISGSSAFSKSSLNIWKFSVHVLLKPSLKNFEHYFASMWNECKCVVVWTFFGIAFLWDWNENWPFPVLWSLLSFPYLLSCPTLWDPRDYTVHGILQARILCSFLQGIFLTEWSNPGLLHYSRILHSLSHQNLWSRVSKLNIYKMPWSKH